MFSSSSSSLISQALLASMRCRKLLNQPARNQSLAPPPGSSNTFSGDLTSSAYDDRGSFDADLTMILALFLCAVVCVLGLNSVARCALRCSRRSGREAANAGLKKKTVVSLPTLLYSAGSKLSSSDPICSICLSDFIAGEPVRVLPKCNHGFHVGCIDMWLVSHSSCPTCRHCLMSTGQRTISGSQVTNPAGFLSPLGREGLVPGYR
ncbi:unnamed protein product [Victoria cruziana]